MSRNSRGVAFKQLIGLVLLALLGSAVVPFGHRYHAVRDVRLEL